MNFSHFLANKVDFYCKFRVFLDEIVKSMNTQQNNE